MECLVLRHLSGSKAEQVDRWPLAGFREALIGRDPAAAVRYDPDRDDSVSRRHARLERDPDAAGRFLIVDLDSRNGTFVNRRRVQGSAVLSPGDRVQLGPGGPEFEVAIEVVAAEGGEVSPDTGLLASEPADEPPPEPGQTVVVASDDRREVRSTVRAHRAARTPWLGIAGALVVTLLGVALGARACLSTPEPESSFEAAAGKIDARQETAAISAAEIARRHGAAVCRIEVTWSLVMAETGGLLYHEHRVERDRQGRPAPGAVPVPVYVRSPDGHVEPALVLDPGDLGQNQAIGGLHAGSGFAVTRDGLLLTGRQVVAPWTAAYSLPAGPGVLVSLQAGAGELVTDPPRDWVPIHARAIGRGASPGIQIAGRIERLEVVIPEQPARASGQIRGASAEHDVAVVEIDVLRLLDTVEPGADPIALAPGAQVTVLGYASVITSSTPDGRAGNALVVVPATIGPARQPEVTGGEAEPGRGGRVPGEVLELMTISADPGTHGGPVFDDRGRLAGSFSLGGGTPGTSRALVVPIRFGLDLLRAEQSRR